MVLLVTDRPITQPPGAAMTDIATTVDAYLAGYGEPDADRREALMHQAFTDEATLIDPPLEGRGRAGIVSMAATVQSLYPGHRFRRASAIDEHHGFARYAWQLLTPDDTVALSGLDVVEVAEDGRIRQVVGFFGDLVVVPPVAQ
jgi:hypothetical protein